MVRGWKLGGGKTFHSRTRWPQIPLSLRSKAAGT